ncbi:MAG: aldo/keto reductase [Caldilineaceae bacterium]|nr:aldo/keto reductase [Caldilineaceae bacterium]
MEYGYLGKSGLYASRISIGGVQLGSEDLSQRQVDRIIAAMFDVGINLIDTAYIYGNGQSEVRIGKALGAKRNDVILVTKGGHYKAQYDPPSVGAPSRRYLVREVETCLKRLNTDYIDVYMWHMGNSVPPHEMLRAMDDLVKSGKVLYIGGSNTPAWKLGVASEYARNHGMNPVVLEQSGYSMLNRSRELDTIPCCLEYGISFMPYRALQSGFLSGRYKQGEPVPEDTAVGRYNKPTLDRMSTDENWEILAQLTQVAGDLGIPLPELALAWLLHQSAVDTVLVGASRPEQVIENAKAANVKLSPDVLARLDEILRRND